MPRRLKDRLLLALAERAGGWYLRRLEKRVDRDSYFEEHLAAARAQGRGVILALWHAQMIPLVVRYRQQGIVALISTHRDGEIIARLVTAFGFRTVRGSTNREPVKAAVNIFKLLKKEKTTVAFTPDGPRGPRERVQGGIIRAAARTGAPVVAMAAMASPCWRVNSWDRFCVPLPWSKFHLRLGVPFTVPRRLTPEMEENYRQRLEHDLRVLTVEAEKSLSARGAWKNRAGELLVRAAVAVWRVLPERAALASGDLLGRLAHLLARRHRRLAQQNIVRALPGRYAGPALRALTRANFAHYGRSLVEFARLGQYAASGMLRKVPFTGEQHLRDAVAGGRGYIMLTAHLGNFELMGGALAAHGLKFVAPARGADAPALERLLQSVRASAGVRMIDKDEAGRALLAALGRNEGIAILIDVNAGHKGIFVPLFGRLASTYTVVAELAKRTGCAVLPVLSHREPDGTHVVDVEAPLPWLHATDGLDEIAANTAQYNRVYEKYIARYPEQWFWAHNRWKTRPPAGRQ